jgi:hypothetical protein
LYHLSVTLQAIVTFVAVLAAGRLLQTQGELCLCGVLKTAFLVTSSKFAADKGVRGPAGGNPITSAQLLKATEVFASAPLLLLCDSAIPTKRS